MKYLIFLLLVSCAPKQEEKESCCELYTMTLHMNDSLMSDKDSIISFLENKSERYKHVIDSLRLSLNESNLRLQAAAYYVKLCDKKPAQKKYFFGWIKNRVLLE